MAIAEPRQKRSERTLEKILTACDQLLSERSFEQISMQDLAREAGVSVGNLYNRFPDKNSLIEHMIERHQLRLLEAIEARLASASDALTTTERLELLVATVEDGVARVGPVLTTIASRRARGIALDSTAGTRSEGIVERCVHWFTGCEPDLDPERCRFAVASIATSLQFDLLFGTQQRLFGPDYRRHLVAQALAYLDAAESPAA